MKFTSGPAATSEIVRFERPNSWQLRGGSKILSSSFEGLVTPSGGRAHLVLRMEIRLRGPERLALPQVRRRMQREFERDIAAIKTTLESSGRPYMSQFEVTELEGGGQDHVLGVGPAPDRERVVTVRPFPSSRRLVTAAVRSGRRIVPMHGLFDVDVTTARRLLAEADPPLSLTAFVVASVGRAAAMHPQVHAYRDWRGRLVEHRHVDVQTLIEVPTSQGLFGLVHVVRDADLRSVAEISAELRAVKTDANATTTGRLLSKLAPAAGHIPGLYRAMYAAMSRSRRVHLATGTVQVTAIGMFADGGGFAIAPPTLASLVVVVGGLSKRPRAVGDRIETREVLDLTVTIDHNIVDGAPATRFVADLRQVLHTAAALGPMPPE